MNIGIIGSSGGSAFSQIVSILDACSVADHEFYVVTDRKCGMGRFCEEHGISHALISEPNNELFSRQCLDHFGSAGPMDFILLFYTRYISPVLFREMPTLNIHPSLLPSFMGLHAVEDAFKAGCKFVGCTLHVVTESIDDGPFVAQAIAPVSQGAEIADWNRISFFQKVYLGLLAIELVGEKRILFRDLNRELVVQGDLRTSGNFNPCISSESVEKELVKLAAIQNVGFQP